MKWISSAAAAAVKAGTLKILVYVRAVCIYKQCNNFVRPLK